MAIISGGGRGIGAAAANLLASAGAAVVLTARSQDQVEAVASRIRSAGAKAIAVPCDVANPDEIEEVVEAALSQFDRVDILVNNAGMNVRKPALEFTPEEFDQVLAVNLKGYFNGAQAAGRRFVAQGSGKVINVSSILGSVALANQAAYASSKGAIDQLTKVLALEWASSGVQVNSLGPTYFETELTRPLYEDPERKAFIEERTPMGRWGQPHELAGAVIFLASDASDFVTGQILLVDGGWTAW